MQKTVHVNGETIRLRTRTVTMAGNPVGVRVHVTDSEVGKASYHVNTLHHQVAMDHAYVRHIKATR